MESKLALEAERDLVEATRKLTATQRLEAFLTHSRLLVAFRDAAQSDRATVRVDPPSRPGE